MRPALSFKRIALSRAWAMPGPAAMASANPRQLTIRDILTRQTQLRSQVAAGKGAFEAMGRRERDALVTRQDRILGALGGNESFDQRPPEVRVTVFDDLEWIEAAVT